MQKTPYQIIDITQKLKDGQPSRRFKVRAVLKWFGAKRRGDAILADIQDTFLRYGLTTEPSFDKPEIDDYVRFALIQIPISNNSAAEVPAETAIEHSDRWHDSEGWAAAEPDTQNQQTAPSEPQNNQVRVAASDGYAEATSASTEDQLEPENGDEPSIGKPDDHPVTSQISDWTIAALTDKLNRGNLVLQPKFQRLFC